MGGREGMLLVCLHVCEEETDVGNVRRTGSDENEESRTRLRPNGASRSVCI